MFNLGNKKPIRMIVFFMTTVSYINYTDIALTSWPLERVIVSQAMPGDILSIVEGEEGCCPEGTSTGKNGALHKPCIINFWLLFLLYVSLLCVQLFLAFGILC